MYYFEPLAAFVDSLYEHYGLTCSDVIVYKGGEIVFRRIAGFSDAECKVPASENDLYRLYSASKLITSTAGLRLIEQGKIGLDDPVSKYLPAYANLTVKQPDGSVKPAKNVMTIRHLLNMQSGLDYDMQRGGAARILAEKGDQASTVEICNAFAEGPLDFEPGTHFHYALSIDVLGAVIEVVSGMKLSEYMKKELFDPLGMKDMVFIVNDEQLSRISVLRSQDKKTYKTTPLGTGDMYRLSPNYEAGGGALTSSAYDFMLLCAALANKGTGMNGYQVLKPETIDLLRTPQLTPEMHLEMMRAFPYMPGYDYGLGSRVFINNNGFPAAKGHFGWEGASGFYYMIDPDNDMALVFAQTVMGSSPSFDIVMSKMRDLAYLCLRGDIRELNEEVPFEKR